MDNLQDKIFSVSFTSKRDTVWNTQKDYFLYGKVTFVSFALVLVPGGICQEEDNIINSKKSKDV